MMWYYLFSILPSGYLVGPSRCRVMVSALSWVAEYRDFIPRSAKTKMHLLLKKMCPIEENCLCQ